MKMIIKNIKKLLWKIDINQEKLNLNINLIRKCLKINIHNINNIKQILKI